MLSLLVFKCFVIATPAMGDCRCLAENGLASDSVPFAGRSLGGCRRLMQVAGVKMCPAQVPGPVRGQGRIREWKGRELQKCENGRVRRNCCAGQASALALLQATITCSWEQARRWSVILFAMCGLGENAHQNLTVSQLSERSRGILQIDVTLF